MRERKGSMQVIDIVIEGISMALTQRNEVASLIDRKGGRVSVIIEELRRRTAHLNPVMTDAAAQ